MSVLAAAVASLARLVHHASNQVGTLARDVPVLAAAVALGPVGLAVARVVVQTAALEAHNTAAVMAVLVVVVVVRRAVHVHGASVSHVSATSAMRVSALVSLSHGGVHARVAVGGRGVLGGAHVAHAHVALEVAGRGPVAELVAAVTGHMSLRRIKGYPKEG